MNIYHAITQVMSEIGAVGKTHTNTQGAGYKFRGIDDLYNATQAALIKAGVFSVPTVLEMTREERTSKAGGLLLWTTLKIKYIFYAGDGSSVEAITMGEAMDSGDKSCNKAMSAAQKYAFLQVFAIPTEEPKDTENETHEVGKKEEKKQWSKGPTGTGTGGSLPPPSAKKDEIPEFSTETRPLAFDQLREKILATTALPHLKNVWMKYKADIAILSVEETKRLTAVKDAKKKELSIIKTTETAEEAYE